MWIYCCLHSRMNPIVSIMACECSPQTLQIPQSHLKGPLLQHQGLGKTLHCIAFTPDLGRIGDTGCQKWCIWGRREEQESRAAPAKGAPSAAGVKWHLCSHCHHGGQSSNHSAESNLQTLGWHAIIFKITLLLLSRKHNVAFNPRNSAMSSNYIEP